MTLHIYQGHRLRTGRFSEAGQFYLVTSVTGNRKPLFRNLFLGRILVQTLRNESKRAKTLCYVVMPDHFHWLLQLQEGELPTVVRNIKSVSAHRINKQLSTRQKIWQAGYHDHAVRNESDIRRLARYVIANPLRAGLVDCIGDYALWDAVWV